MDLEGLERNLNEWSIDYKFIKQCFAIRVQCQPHGFGILLGDCLSTFLGVSTWIGECGFGLVFCSLLFSLWC